MYEAVFYCRFMAFYGVLLISLMASEGGERRGEKVCRQFKINRNGTSVPVYECMCASMCVWSSDKAV